MELYFQEKLSFKGKVEITDAEGKVIYTGKKGFWSGELILKNAEGKKVLAIGETAGLFNKRFIIHKKRKKIATMKKKLLSASFLPFSRVSHESHDDLLHRTR